VVVVVVPHQALVKQQLQAVVQVHYAQQQL
jgi:hypothetical protein